MTGLLVGLRLSQKGFRVVVHERDRQTGGLLGEGVLVGIPIDLFYHCVLPADTALLGLLKELGIDVNWARTRTGFLCNGTVHELTTLRDFLSFRPIGIWDRLRLGWTVAYCGAVKDRRHFDRVSINSFLLRHSGSKVFHTVWEPLLLAKLGREYGRFSAGFIQATVKRMLSARSTVNKSEKLGYIPGRYGRVLRGLQEAIEARGGSIVCDEPVTSVSQRSDGTWIVAARDATHEADAVVLTVPWPLASKLLKGLRPSLPDVPLGTDYLGVVCNVLLLNQPISPYYVINLADIRLPFTGIVEFTNLAQHEEFSGKSLVYLPRYCQQDSPLWEREDEELHRETVRSLATVFPGFSEGNIVAWGVNRARYVQPIHDVAGAERRVPTKLAERLAYVGASQRYPRPVFNNEVVTHVGREMANLEEIVG